MGIYTLSLYQKSKANKVPLVMDQAESRNESEYVIDITSGEASRSNSISDTLVNESNSRQYVDVSSISESASVNNAGNNVRNMSLTRREISGVGRSYWVFTELVIAVSQIIAAVVVLYMSRHEHPKAPLFGWVIGYASGCVATLPLLFWRVHNRNQDPSHPRQTNILFNARFKVFFEYFKMGLDCFFAVWFVVGNIWIFGSHSSDAPNLYRLCIIFLTFCCIGYAMPFILCATICCCLPCIISFMGYREDPTHNRGATTECINSLPTYKFKVKKIKHTNDKELNLGGSEGGVVAAGTEKEHIISGEDAVCSICLGKYANNEELRELACSHLFHKNCVDKWLKINASCPLCKTQVGESNYISQVEVIGS